jgi:hypothetical protein
MYLFFVSLFIPDIKNAMLIFLLECVARNEILNVLILSLLHLILHSSLTYVNKVHMEHGFVQKHRIFSLSLSHF